MYKLTIAGVLAWFMLGGHAGGHGVVSSGVAAPTVASAAVVGGQAAAVGMEAAHVAYGVFAGMYKAVWQAIQPQLGAAMAGVKNNMGGKAYGSAYSAFLSGTALNQSGVANVAQNASKSAVEPVAGGTWYDHAGEVPETACTEGPTDNQGGFHYCY